jgi:hypothetical protein
VDRQVAENKQNTNKQEKEALEQSILAIQEQAEAGTQAAATLNTAKSVERRKAEATLTRLLEEGKVLEGKNQASHQVPYTDVKLRIELLGVLG